MSESPAHPLLAFARELQHAATFGELLDAVQKESQAALGYPHAWLFVADTEDLAALRLIDASGTKRAAVWDGAPRLTVRGDAMLEEIVSSDAPVVVVDARFDPRTDKRIVEQLGNRTIINIPLRLLDKPFGALGIGTFGDEGCRAPTPEQLEYLVGMGSQVAVAAGRIRFLEERSRAASEKLALERRIMQMQKLESLGMLAGGIAHDFNNLIGIMLMTGSALATRSTDAQTREDAGVIVAAAERARALTRQLLAMSRAQALRLEVLDMNGRLTDLVTLLRRVMPQDIEITVIGAEPLSGLVADASQIDQVVMNLCINARDAMPNGGRITLTTEDATVGEELTDAHPWATAGAYVVTTVTDTGVGMASDVVRHVFEPFFTTKPESEGTGLGLAVSYGIVVQHGGILLCSSTLGVGTTFKVYLPVRPASRDERPERRTGQDAARGAAGA